MSKTIELAKHLEKLHINNMYKSDFYWTWDKTDEELDAIFTVADALRHVRSGEYDSAFSAEKIQTFAWFEGRPLNYALDDIPRTQTIEPVYIETSAFFIFPRTLWCGRGRRIGEKPYMAVVDRIEGLDIDNPEDFTMAEIIAASRRLG